MKRAIFYIDERDRDNAERTAQDEGVPFSVFVRQAVLEKLDRQLIVGQATQMRSDLAALVDEFRSEVARTRRDVMDDQQRGVDLVREAIDKSMKKNEGDIGKSLRKNEEMNKTFLMMLTNATAGGKPSRAQPQPASQPWDDAPAVTSR